MLSSLDIINYVRGLMKKPKYVSIESLHKSNIANADLSIQVLSLRKQLEHMKVARTMYIIVLPATASKDAATKWSNSVHAFLLAHKFDIGAVAVVRGDTWLPEQTNTLSVDCIYVSGKESAGTRINRLKKELLK